MISSMQYYTNHFNKHFIIIIQHWFA